MITTKMYKTFPVWVQAVYGMAYRAGVKAGKRKSKPKERK